MEGQSAKGWPFVKRISLMRCPGASLHRAVLWARLAFTPYGSINSELLFPPHEALPHSDRPA